MNSKHFTPGVISAATGSILMGLALVFAAGKPAFAQTPLPPGTTSGVPVPTIATGTPPFGGTLLQELQSPIFGSNVTNTISGTLTSAAFRNPSGFLDFLYQFSFNSSTNVIIDAVSIASFAGIPGVAVAQTTEDVDGPGGLPAENLGNANQNNFIASSATNSFDTATRPNFSGSTINAPLLTGVTGGDTTFTFIVRTEATGFSLAGSASVQGGGISAFTVAQGAIAPVPGILSVAPEPTALSLLALGLVASVTGVVRRRRSA